MDEDTDDARLMRAAQDGDKEAFALLLTRHRTLLVSLCRRVLRDDDAAQDVAQEAALQAYLSLDRLKRAGRFGPWLGGIGLNLCRHRLRRRRPDLTSSDALDGGRHDPLRDLPDEEVGPDERAELLDLRVRVQRAVADLPRGQRAAVALFYLHGFSHAETAAQLGIEVGAVKTRLHKARGTLRKTLWELWEEQDMTTTTADMALVRVRIDAVRKNYKTGQSVIILKEVDEREEVDRSRGLFVWVGEVEAEALGRTLLKEDTPRPLTYTLMANLLHAGACACGKSGYSRWPRRLPRGHRRGGAGGDAERGGPAERRPQLSGHPRRAGQRRARRPRRKWRHMAATHDAR